MIFRNKLLLRMLAVVVVLALSLPIAAAAGGAAASKTVNMSAAYGITTMLSLFLAIGYGALVRKKDTWLFLLYLSVVIVNLGYFALSISKTLEEALLANRIAYFGSVFLPLCMLMAIMYVCRISCRKWMMGLLLCISAVVFLVAASPGYLDWYYKDVTLVFVNGMAKLDKVYGPLHAVYLFYLVLFFVMMIGVIAASILKRKAVSHKHAFILLTIVFLNLSIWFIEQLIYTDFEFLSVSYIISELLLLMLYGMMQDYGIIAVPETKPKTVVVPEKLDAEQDTTEAEAEVPVLQTELVEEPGAAPVAEKGFSEEQIEQIVAVWSEAVKLTKREAEVLRAILRNAKRKEIAEEMNVTEHTVKKHTGNIFLKLEVSNRAELFEKVDKFI